MRKVFSPIVNVSSCSSSNSSHNLAHSKCQPRDSKRACGSRCSTKAKFESCRFRGILESCVLEEMRKSGSW